MLKTQPNLLLASKSPRRQELLKAAGIQFQTIDIDVEETYPDDMEVELVPEYLARKKAEAAVHFLFVRLLPILSNPGCRMNLPYQMA